SQAAGLEAKGIERKQRPRRFLVPKVNALLLMIGNRQQASLVHEGESRDIARRKSVVGNQLGLRNIDQAKSVAVVRCREAFAVTTEGQMDHPSRGKRNRPHLKSRQINKEQSRLLRADRKQAGIGRQLSRFRNISTEIQ